MQQRNKFWSGLIYGLVLPIAGYFLLNSAFSLLEIKGVASGTGLSENFRERTLAIVAIALNLFVLSRFRRLRWENAMRGTVIATVLLATAWLARYGMSLV